MYINSCYELQGLKTIVKIMKFIWEQCSLINVCLNWEVGLSKANFIDIG